MQCRLCGHRAGFLRRQCQDCGVLWQVWQDSRLAGMRGILEALQATGVNPEKLQQFLEAEPEAGKGKVRDLIAADMTNQLLGALGQKGQQTGERVRVLRERGGWKTLDRPPE